MIHSRKSWRARTPHPRTPQSPKNVTELFVHWPGGVPRSWRNIKTAVQETATMRSIQEFHMGPERGWSDFAYSFAIFPSGRIYRGRGMDWVPASQLSHNTGTASVCVFLGPDDPVPSAVIDAIKDLRNHCEKRAGRKLRLRPHRSVNSTDCPGSRLATVVAKLA